MGTPVQSMAFQTDHAFKKTYRKLAAAFEEHDLGKHRVRISIINYFIHNPINPTLQPAVSAVNNLDQPLISRYPVFLEPIRFSAPIFKV